MAVLKVIEIMKSSPKSWEDGTTIAIKTAEVTLKGICSIYIHHLSALMKDNKISEFLVNAKITFGIQTLFR